MKKFTWIITLAIVLLGCTNEYAVKIPVGSDGQLAESEDFKAVVAELPMVDKEALAAYLIRASMAAAMTTMPLQQVTIGEAIAAQRKFEAEQKAVAEKEAAAQAKIAAEEKAARDAYEAKQKRVREMVSGSLLAKNFRPADYMRGVVQDALMFTVMFKNNTGKEISGMRGELVLNNTLGDKISSIWITNEESIPAGGEFTWNGGLNFNQFMEDHMAMKNAELSKIISVWQPTMIMFSDGTIERLEEQ